MNLFDGLNNYIKKTSSGSSSSAHRLLRKRESYNTMDDSKKQKVLSKMWDYTRDMRITTSPSMQAAPTNAQSTSLYIHTLIHPTRV
jgi:hypothetical protein